MTVLPSLPSVTITSPVIDTLRDPLRKLRDAGMKQIGSSLLGIGESPTTIFPLDLMDIDHWITFTAYKTKSATRLAKTKTQEMTSIALPIPGNLQTAYNISYTETSLGAIGREFMDALGGNEKSQELVQSLGGAALIGGAFGGLVGGGGGMAAGAMGGMSAEAIRQGVEGNQTALQVGLSTVMGESQIAAAAAAQFGIARNPHKVVLFDSVGFRKHSFSYQFTPRNRNESIILKDIIKSFKLHASPGLDPKRNVSMIMLNNTLGTNIPDLTLSGGKHFFDYPEHWLLRFHHPKFLFNIGHSFLTSIDVNYQPAGAPTYARDPEDIDPAPTQINLSLTFTETDIVTKDEISEGR